MGLLASTKWHVRPLHTYSNHISHLRCTRGRGREFYLLLFRIARASPSLAAPISLCGPFCIPFPALSPVSLKPVYLIPLKEPPLSLSNLHYLVFYCIIFLSHSLLFRHLLRIAPSQCTHTSKVPPIKKHLDIQYNL